MTRGTALQAQQITDAERERFSGYVATGAPDACWPWRGARNRSGYGTFRVAGRRLNASRVAAAIAEGSVEADAVVAHCCDNPPCCNPAHLFLTSQYGNVRDMIAKRRDGFRLNLPSAWNGGTRTVSDAIAIVECSARDIPTRAIGAMFGVSHMFVSRVIRGRYVIIGDRISTKGGA